MLNFWLCVHVPIIVHFSLLFKNCDNNKVFGIHNNALHIVQFPNATMQQLSWNSSYEHVVAWMLEIKTTQCFGDESMHVHVLKFQ